MTSLLIVNKALIAGMVKDVNAAERAGSGEETEVTTRSVKPWLVRVTGKLCR